jgi:squalene-hopene/tetraprenyl-beta-curcumene cyclase
MQQIRTVGIVASLALTLAASMARSQTTTTDSRSTARAAITRGLDWLQQNQATNGAWSRPGFPALSGLPLWAISASGETNRQAMADRAIAFILSCVQTNGGIYVNIPGIKGGGMPNYNTAICMTALHATGRKDLTPVILQARTFVGTSQHLGDDVYNGGFGYDRATGRAYTDLDNTMFALEAMRRTQNVEDQRPASEKRVDINWTAALDYVSKLQNSPTNSSTNDAGGFFYNPDDAKAGTGTNAAGQVYLRSFGSITYVGLLSMVYANVTREDPRVTSAVDFATRHWTLEENPGMGPQGLFFYYNVMARALAVSRHEALPRKDGAAIAWREELIRKITSLQKADGSWQNTNNRYMEGDPVLATSFNLLALAFAADLTR